MIKAVKIKAKRANKKSIDENRKPVIFKNQLFRAFSSKNNNTKISKRRIKYFEKSSKGGYELKTKEPDKNRKKQNNYFRYIERTAKIMNEHKIVNQLSKHNKILNTAIEKHFYSNLNK